MTAKERGTKPGWTDPDDAPEWSDEIFARAEIAVGGKVVRPAGGTLTRRGVAAGSALTQRPDKRKK